VSDSVLHWILAGPINISLIVSTTYIRTIWYHSS